MPTHASPIFNIITASTILTTAGQTVESLAAGQIGLFDATTGLSIVPTAVTANTFKDVLIVTKAADGTIHKNAGSTIQTPQIKYVTATCPANAVNPVLEFTFSGVRCNADYGIKINVEDAQTTFFMGRSLNTRTYMIKTDCCTDGCAPCAAPLENNHEVVIKLWQYINKDNENGKLVASVVDSANVAVPDPIVYAADPDNATNNLKLRVTVLSQPKAANGTSNINLNYYSTRQASVTGSIVGDRCSDSRVELVVAPTFAVGDGYDLLEKERQALGWGPMGVYRLDAATCLPKDATLYIQAGLKYKVVAIGYHNSAAISFDTVESPNETYIAFPSTVTDANVNTFIGYLNFLAANGHAKAAPTLACTAV